MPIRTHKARLWSARRQAAIPGDVLTMADGSQWFHPANGDAPWREA